eukprot:c17278_g1_i1.p1 GENE.c17278_g1_i1~~c17278_g1_i1.p1  ORF type:complete len:282 (+),score=58.02 c17278_g1_i1:59-904(+)
MAEAAGDAIRKQFEGDTTFTKDSRIQMWVSPFQRTRETAVGILNGLGDLRTRVTVRESPLLVEQDWGVFEGVGGDDERYRKEKDRIARMKAFHGKFWARTPLGESCFDVCLRVRVLFDSIMRAPGDRCIIVSHGVTIRAFVMMWCRRTPEWFDASQNPPNCSVRMLDPSLTSKDEDCGYIFGGFNEDTPIDRPLSVSALNKPILDEVRCIVEANEFLDRWLQAFEAPSPALFAKQPSVATFSAWVRHTVSAPDTVPPRANRPPPLDLHGPPDFETKPPQDD